MIKGLSLHQRDKAALLTGSLLVLCLLAVGGIVTIGTGLGRLDRTIALRTTALRDLGPLRSEAQLLQQQLRLTEEKLARTPAGSLAAVTEGLAARIAGQGSLAYLRPLAALGRDGMTIETLECKLERQSLEQVLRLLWEVENNPAAVMRIQSLRLQRHFDNHALLDATMTINAYRK